MMAVETVALFKSQLYGLFGGLLGVRSIPTLPKYCKAHFGENGHDIGHTGGEGLRLKFIKHFQIFHSLLSTQREKNPMSAFVVSFFKTHEKSLLFSLQIFDPF